MSNIGKLLETFVGHLGESLVVNTLEPIYMMKGGKRFVLYKKVLTEGEFRVLESEYHNEYGIDETLEFMGKRIRVEWSQESLIFSSAPLESSPQDFPKVESTAYGHEDYSPAPASGAGVPPAYEGKNEREGDLAPASVSYSPSRRIDLDELLTLMIERKASDLHVTSNSRPIMRIDGEIISLDEFPVVVEEDLWDELRRIAPERNILEFQETNDTDFAYQIPRLSRYRSNIFRDVSGVGAVFRVIPTKILTVDQLKVPWGVVELCNVPKGLILVTGPTGSGKSTSLAALINHINETQRKHIITIEDPVEFIHPNKMSLVNQREVHSHTLSFKRALRAALREDPDIILVGEMRDLETIAIAIEMAVTGHLVFGTLHTSTAIGTVDRIIDQFPADQQAQIRTMLSDALLGVLAQTLCKRKEGGRVGAYEVLVVTNAVSNLIREGKTFQIATMMQTGKSLGMQMINSHLTELVEKGIVTAEEAISKAVEKDNLKMNLKGKNLWTDPSAAAPKSPLSPR